MSNGFLLGPLGSMVDVSSAVSVGGVDVSANRATSEFVTLGGARYIQSAAWATRTWNLKGSMLTPQATRYLIAASQPQTKFDLWLLDEAAARANMLTPDQAVGAQSGTVTVDGLPLPAFHTTSGTGTDLVFTVPVLAQQYTLSIWTMATTGTVATYSAPGASGSLTGAAGSPARRAATFTATSAGTLTITVKGNLTALSSALRLIPGADDAIPWIAGHGTPCRVFVDDPDRSLRWLPATGQAYFDYTFTVREVGVPGVI